MSAVKLLQQCILASQKSETFSARGSYSHRGDLPASSFPEAEVEFAESDALLENFTGSGFDLLSAIAGRRILDFGSGFGGRTVWYAKFAAEVYGVEPFSHMVEKSARFSAHKCASNCHFVVGNETEIAFPDDYFDVILSYDVIEHVERPDKIIPEMHRTLAPGGLAFIVFTPYFGMFSHHLNYVTLLPALHWFFSPHTIVAAVNEVLASRPDLNMRRQPPPALSFNGRRYVLPSLNGITKQEFLAIVRKLGLEQLFERSTPILEKFPVFGRVGAALNRLLCSMPGLDEAFAHNLVTVLRKPAAK